MTVVSISMPESLVERLDEFAEEHGYTGRSEVVREGARNLLGEFEDRRLEDRHLLGVITVVFNYETSNAEERMMQLRHEHESLVTSNVHSHVGDHYCMELFIVEGSLEEISGFVGKVRATQDTLSVDYSVLPVDDFDGVLEEATAAAAADGDGTGDHAHGDSGGDAGGHDHDHGHEDDD